MTVQTETPQIHTTSTATPTLNELKEAAKNYHEQGLAVVPFNIIWNENKKQYDKNCWISWDQWENTTQTTADFETLNWRNANAFGVVLGTKAKNGKYLVEIDWDPKSKNVRDEGKTLGKTILQELPITRITRTANNGLHYEYWSSTKCKTTSTFHDQTAIELLCEKKISIMAPSFNYQTLNDNSPTELDNVEDKLNEVFNRHGFKQQKQTPPTTTYPTIQNKTALRPCINEALKQPLTGPLGHKMRLAIAAEHKKVGYSTEEIIELFKPKQDFKLETTLTQIASANPALTANCQTIAEYGFCLLNCTWKNQQSDQNIPLAEQPFKDDLEALAYDPKIEDRLLADIHRTIKNDDVVVCDTFHAGLSAYFDPFNLAHKAKSGAGKTYDTIGTIEYYPEEDVVIIGSQSPKVISHDYGELITLNEKGVEIPLNLDDAPRKPMRREYETKEEFEDAYNAYKNERKTWDNKLKNSFHLIRLTGKIYVFLDTISRETFEMFKCTLSHDKQRISHKFVDEQAKVHTTVLEGWPSTIFCTVDKDFLEEFATRTFTDTPETSAEKIQAAQEVTDNKRSFPWEYEEDTEEKKLIKALIRTIRDTVKQYNLKAVKPFPNLRNSIKFCNENTRDMRDFEHFNQMLPTYTAFKLFQRPIITVNKQKYVIASIDDVLAALNLFDQIAETTRTSTEKPVLDFYHKHVQHHKTGAVLKDILADAPEMRSERTARSYLDRLAEIGWVNIEQGKQNDKRLLTYYPLKDATETQEKLVQTTANKRNTADLRLELEKDFNIWFKTITTMKTDIQIEKIKFSDRTLESISIDELKKFVGIDSSSVVIVSNDETKPFPETEAETKVNKPIAAVLPNSQPTKNSEDNTKIFHFQRLGPNDNHSCDACKGLLAEHQQILNDEQKKKVNKDTLYFCESCFESAKVKAEADGCRFTEDMPEYQEEAPTVEA